MSSPHDLVLFDLDGTISDPQLGISRSLNHALTHFGYAPLELKDCLVHIGPPLDVAFRSITGSTSQGHIEELVAKYRERYADVGCSENVLYPGIGEALAALSEADVPLDVCTSKRVDFAERILEMFGLRGYFRFINGGEIGIHKWQQIESLLSQGSVSASTVMVGDRAVDLVAAHRNGLHSAGVLWGHGSREELSIEKPRYLFNSPAELPSLAGINTHATPAFGERISRATYIVRPGAYAVIFDNEGRVAAIRGATGHFLPGGGVENGETPEAALHRELLEECAATIEISNMIGHATDFIYSADESAYFEKQGAFYLARFTAPPASKDLEWLALDSVNKLFRQEGHAWAVMHTKS